MKRSMLAYCALIIAIGILPVFSTEPAKTVAPGYLADKGGIFPEAYFIRYDTVDGKTVINPAAAPYVVPERKADPVLAARKGDGKYAADRQIIAFYGSPNSSRMGILGQYSLEDLVSFMDSYANYYDAINGEEGVVPAFFIVYGTVWPGGEIGYLGLSKLKPYLDYAQAHGMLVFIDHQLGRYSVREAMERLLPFLKYPCANLALDPEWHTERPMEEIGWIDAEEVNEAQAMMRDYMAENGIRGKKILVVHQFNWKMIARRELVRSDFENVVLIHDSDGFGTPEWKIGSYAYNSLATNMPLKGFKLFFETDVSGAGYDTPLLPPEEVLKLRPRPVLVMYQ
jgi:hypothetical protein